MAATDLADLLTGVLGSDIEIDVEGHEDEFVLLVPNQPAAEWLRALCAPESARLPLLVDQASRSFLIDLLLADQVTAEAITDSWRNLVELATGRRWFEAEKLAGVIIGSWHGGVGGHMVLAGVDARTIPFALWLDAGLAVLQKLCDKDTMKQIMADLSYEPTPSGDPDDMTMDEEQFHQVMSAM